MKPRRRGAKRLTRPRPASRAARSAGLSFENSQFTPSMPRARRVAVEAPPALIAFQNVGRADVFAPAAGGDQHLGQGCDITQAKVQPLPCNRVNAMGGVAHQSEARGNVAVGQRQGQQVAEARARKRDFA